MTHFETTMTPFETTKLCPTDDFRTTLLKTKTSAPSNLGKS